MKKILMCGVVVIAIFATVMLFSCNMENLNVEKNVSIENKKVGFDYWDKNSEPLKKLINFVEDVTNTKSTNFIPEEDRIVVVDFDGTIYGENAPIKLQDLLFTHRVLTDPSYIASPKQYKMASLLKATIDFDRYKNASGYDVDVLEAEVYKSMSRDKYSEYVKNFLKSQVLGYENITYEKLFILPMVEVLNYLKEKNFTIFIVAGSDRELMRTIAADKLGIPYSNFIGSDAEYKVSEEIMVPNFMVEEKKVIPYYYEYNENMFSARSGRIVNLNYNGNKVFNIEKEIGKKPVLCFGNSYDDVSMAKYTLTKNKYNSIAFMLVADDKEREYADIDKELANKDKWEMNGFDVISMRKDFTTIYGEDVIKSE